jgi:hypothetical protein
MSNEQLMAIRRSTMEVKVRGPFNGGGRVTRAERVV